MISHIILLLFGLAVLLIAGDLLVRGAVGLALAARIPALLVSLTIVAFGTSAPELVVSIEAALKGAGGIAIGNIVGSNIANVFLVLGIPALIYPIATSVDGLRGHVLIMLAATAGISFLAYGPGAISPLAGACLMAGVLAYTAFVASRALTGRRHDPALDDIEAFSDGRDVNVRTLIFVAAGLGGLPLGAHLLVTHGSAIAAAAGIREAVIGLTVVAFGTSLPELATVAAAALRKKSDVAIGGVIGSNIFNILAVGGAAGLAGGVGFDPQSRILDMPVMIAAALFLSYFVATKQSVGRLAGVVCLAAYAAFIAGIVAYAAV